MSVSRLLLGSLLVVCTMDITGCKPQVEKDLKPTAPLATPVKEKTSDEASESAMPDGLAELSAEDRALAIKQRICPVSGEALGTMGTPMKITIKGKTVFLCCPGCEKEIKDNPDKYLAKLQEAEAKK